MPARRCFALGLLLCPLVALASTNITTPTVSGQWTAAGSPYYIFNDIKVAVGQSLTIAPGVDVRFQGHYKFEVEGILDAAGTASQRIRFHTQDTTGWANWQTNTGGWKGIYFKPLPGGVVDSSVFKFCDVYDVKAGNDANVSAFSTIRPLAITDCNFYHCTTTLGYIIGLLNWGSTPFVRNTMHDCLVWNSICFYATNNKPQKDSILDNSFYANNGKGGICRTLGNFCFQGNSIYDNETEYGGPLVAGNGNVVVRKNVFRGNTSTICGAMQTFQAVAVVEGNFMHNNERFHPQGFCGYTDGGGAILVTNNLGDNTDSLYTIVRNNVIVHNRTDWVGGAVNAVFGNVKLVNNTIANNYAKMGGAAVYISGEGSKAHIKNNIFSGNDYNHTACLDSAEILVLGDAQTTVHADYNWMQRPFHKIIANQLSLQPSSTYTIVGDTSHNIVGSAPGFVSAATVAGFSPAAANANFGLTAASVCVDQGDTSSAFPALIDYVNSPRIAGPKIDIGAYEIPQHGPAAVNALRSADGDVLLYPNPSGDFLMVRLPTDVAGTDCTFTVYSSAGRLVRNGTWPASHSSESVHLAGLPAGIYIIRIQAAESTRTYRVRFTKY